MEKLIGLCGAKRSGKTLAANHLIGQGYNKFSMASVLRDMLLAMGIDHRYLYEDKNEIIPDLGVTGRFMLQTLGTEWGRDTIHSNVWVMAMAHKLRKCVGKIVIDDIRFPNEVQMVKDLGGTLVYIQRDEAEEVTDEHSSEQLYKTVQADYIVHNNGSLDNFKRLLPALTVL